MEISIPIVFHSVEDVISVFNRDDFKSLEPVKKLLEVYNKTLSQYGSLKPIDKKFSFVVFEGLVGTSKHTISNLVSKQYKATLLKTPPQSISSLKSFFDHHPQLRVPFYSLANYIAELEVLAALLRGPVVLDRYWHSTAAFSLSKSVQDKVIDSLPPKFDKIYTWPSDLLKPDIVIGLYTTEGITRPRLSKEKMLSKEEELFEFTVKFGTDIIQVYESIVDPKVTFVFECGRLIETMTTIFVIMAALGDFCI